VDTTRNTDIDIEGTASDVAGGDVQKTITTTTTTTAINGVDGNKMIDMLQAQLRYNWDDDQRRELRQAQADEDRRRHEEDRRKDRDSADLQWAMMRQRFDVIITRLENLERAAITTITEARYVRVSIVVLIVVIVVLVVSFVAHTYGVLAFALQAVGALAVGAGLAYRATHGH
jgi:hypothetical protein